MIEDYRKARKRGTKEVNKALARGRHPFPPALDDQMRGLPFARETSMGHVEIPLELVVGTKTRGRQNLFSTGFMPFADEDTEFATKWSRLHDAQVSEGFREPIAVYECLQRFYVQEGNKRVSVARYLGMPSIMADVRRVVPVPSVDMDEELARYREFERFYAVAPTYDLVLSHAEGYGRLARLLGRDLVDPWPEEDVRHLRSMFHQFRLSYLQGGGERLGYPAADAFLLYLQTYARADDANPSPSTVHGRVRQMWGEFVVASKQDPIAFVSDPPVVERGAVSKAVNKLRATRPLIVAFVYDRTSESSGWVALHEGARRDLGHRLGRDVRTLAFEGCAIDDAFEAAVRQARDEGSSLVFTTSPRQMDQTHRAAVSFSDCTFFNCSVNLTSSVVRTYYARMYEVKFIMGALAASLSQSHQVGYVAFSPINGAVSEVNAFALGVALVDPYATVHLKWLAASPDWRDELLGTGVDVVCDRDFVDPTSPDEPIGLYALGDGNVLPVARPVWDWGRYYDLVLRGIRAGSGRVEAKSLKGHAINYWWGMRAGVVRLELEEGIAQGQRRLVDTLTRSLVEGQLDPFDTLLIDQCGTRIRAADGKRLTDEQIASMSWLNVNVAGCLPDVSELSLGGRADVEAAGVIHSGSDGA